MCSPVVSDGSEVRDFMPGLGSRCQSSKDSTCWRYFLFECECTQTTRQVPTRETAVKVVVAYWHATINGSQSSAFARDLDMTSSSSILVDATRVGIKSWILVLEI